jgi:plasmid stability protein
MVVRSGPVRMLPRSTCACTRSIVALLGSALLFAGFLATARNAQAADGLSALHTAAIAPPPADGAPAPLQDAVTDQTSSATATVAHPDQSNVVVIIRINSPGDDIVSPTNVIAVGATSANDSATNQEQAAGAAPAAAAAQTEDTTPTVGASPASVPAADARHDESEPAPAGKAILASYAPASVSPSATASSATPANHHAQPVHPSGGTARTVATTPIAQTPAKLAAHTSARPAQAVTTARAARHASSTAGRVRQQLAKVLGGGRTAAATALAADPAGESDLGDFALAAVLAGLAACVAIAFLPRARNRLRARV